MVYTSISATPRALRGKMIKDKKMAEMGGKIMKKMNREKR